MIVCACCLALPAAAQSIGAVKSVEGEVSLQRNGTVIAVAPGDPVFLDDRVVTARDSSFGATLDDGTTIALGEGTSMEFERFAFNPGQQIFNLVLTVLSGRMIYNAGRIGEAAPERVRIETPQLSVGTRGTRFAVITPPAFP